MNKNCNFIVVDDNIINTILCQVIIRQVFPEAAVQKFTDPAAALQYVQSAYTIPKLPDAVLFLDINMPVLSGWDFLEEFEHLSRGIKEHFKIFMLSSSVDPLDKEKAALNKNVWDYIEKPLTRSSIRMMLS